MFLALVSKKASDCGAGFLEHWDGRPRLTSYCSSTQSHVRPSCSGSWAHPFRSLSSTIGTGTLCIACAPSPAYNFLPITFIRHDHSNVLKPGPTTFHRWLGHGTMWVLTLHGWGFYLFWLLQHEWLEGLAFEKYGTNMLSGTLSWVSGAALWLTSLEWVRRHYFEVCHPFSGRPQSLLPW